jgi:hypothetical protein
MVVAGDAGEVGSIQSLGLPLVAQEPTDRAGALGMLKG